MIYLERLANVLVFVFKLLAKMFFYAMAILMISIQITVCIALTPIILFLQVAEFIIVPFVYYMISGKNYYDKYLPISYVYSDLISCEGINFHKEKTYKFSEDVDYYTNLFNRIKKFSIKPNLKFE